MLYIHLYTFLLQRFTGADFIVLIREGVYDRAFNRDFIAPEKSVIGLSYGNNGCFQANLVFDWCYQSLNHLLSKTWALR